MNAATEKPWIAEKKDKSLLSGWIVTKLDIQHLFFIELYSKKQRTN